MNIAGCNDNSNINSTDAEQQQRTLVGSYLENLKNGNTEDAAKYVLFTDAEVNAGLPIIFCDAMKEYDYKYYTINNMERLNDSIFIADVIVNTNYDSIDKTDYVDVAFRPFVFYYENKYMLALIKEQVPKSLYGELTELPYNYDDNADYIIVDKDDLIFY